MQPGTVIPAAEPDSRRWFVIAILSLGMVVAWMHRSNIPVAMTEPDFRAFFNLTIADRGLLSSGFFWTYAFLQIPAGWLVDRLGVKYPYAIGFFLWSIISATMAFSQNITQVFVMLLLLGVGESVVAPASLRWIRFHFAEKERGLAIGAYMTGTKIGPAVGGLVAAWLIGTYGWRAMFLITGFGSLLWLVPWMFLVKNDDRQIERSPSGAPKTPIPFSRVMLSPVMLGTIIGTFCYMYFVYFCLTWMPAYYREHRGLSLNSMGLFTFFSFGGMAAMAMFAGWAADKMIARGGDPVKVRKGFTIAGFLLASTEVFGAMSSNINVALFFAVFSLTGLGLATANYWALTQTLIPGGAIGRVVGIQNCAANMPGIIAPILSAWLIQKTGGYAAPMQAIWFFMILGVASYVFLVREKYAPKAAALVPGKV